MKHSQDHLARALPTFADSSSTFFDSSTTDLSILIDTVFDSSATDLSILIDASDVSHAIASSYHPLTTHTLRKHNQHNSAKQSIDRDATRAHHANRISASLKALDVELPPHLLAKATKSMEDCNGYPSSLYEQLDKYQPLVAAQSSLTEMHHVLQGHGHGHDDFSVVAHCGNREDELGDLTTWESTKEPYMRVGSHHRDMVEWGEDLSGAGTQFDVVSHWELDHCLQGGVGSSSTTWRPSDGMIFENSSVENGVWKG